MSRFAHLTRATTRQPGSSYLDLECCVQRKNSMLPASTLPCQPKSRNGDGRILDLDLPSMRPVTPFSVRPNRRSMSLHKEEGGSSSTMQEEGTGESELYRSQSPYAFGRLCIPHSSAALLLRTNVLDRSSLQGYPSISINNVMELWLPPTSATRPFDTRRNP